MRSECTLIFMWASTVTTSAFLLNRGMPGSDRTLQLHLKSPPGLDLNSFLFRWSNASLQSRRTDPFWTKWQELGDVVGASWAPWISLCPYCHSTLDLRGWPLTYASFDS